MTFSPPAWFAEGPKFSVFDTESRTYPQAVGCFYCLSGGGVPPLAAVPVMTFMASAIIEPTSAALAGRTRVLLFLASSPNCVMYCSATRSCTASCRPAILHRVGDAADAFGRRGRDGENRRGLTFGLVDLLLPARFRRLDRLPAWRLLRC